MVRNLPLYTRIAKLPQRAHTPLSFVFSCPAKQKCSVVDSFYIASDWSSPVGNMLVPFVHFDQACSE